MKDQIRLNVYLKAVLLTLPLLSLAPQAISQGFGTITPGGVQPNIERRTLPSTPDQPKFDIPPVPDRPLGADEGSKLNVERFKLEGLDDLAASDKNLINTNRLLENIRLSRPDGFTVGQLQEAANEVTQYFRQQGYILALAIVPQQKIEDDTVIIRLLPGKLGSLSTANNQDYSDELLKWPFEDLLGKTVQATEVENALLRLDDYPGLEAFGVFRPGQEVGETELILNAKTESAFDFVVIADDHGVDTTGKQRLIGSMIWNNPTGSGDRLAITALQTFDPEDSTYGAIQYKTLLFTPALSAGFAYSVNDYDISQSIGITDTDGETTIASVFTEYSFIRSRNFNVYGKLDFSRKWAEVSLPEFNFDFGEDNLSVVSTEAGFDSVDSIFGGGISEGSIIYNHGLADFAGSMDSNGNDGESLRTGGSGEYAGGDFQKIAFDFTRLQLVSENHTLLIRAQGQYSDDLLSSIEQFSMGGPNSVRAYPVSEYIRDKALFLSAEWIMNAPGFSNVPAFAGRTWGEVLQFSLFVDYAKGRRNDPLDFEKKEENISGIGLGVELRLSGEFFARMEAATPMSNQDASNGDDPQLWFSAGLEF